MILTVKGPTGHSKVCFYWYSSCKSCTYVAMLISTPLQLQEKSSMMELCNRCGLVLDIVHCGTVGCRDGLLLR